MLASLNHPNVLRFYGAVVASAEDPAVVGIMTEYMRGGSLSQFLTCAPPSAASFSLKLTCCMPAASLLCLLFGPSKCFLAHFNWHVQQELAAFKAVSSPGHALDVRRIALGVPHSHVHGVACTVLVGYVDGTVQ